MGILDSTQHTLTCSQCGKIESQRNVQKGSSFSSHWTHPDFQYFIVKWDGDYLSGICKICNVSAISEMTGDMSLEPNYPKSIIDFIQTRNFLADEIVKLPIGGVTSIHEKSASRQKVGGVYGCFEKVKVQNQKDVTISFEVSQLSLDQDEWATAVALKCAELDFDHIVGGSSNNKQRLLERTKRLFGELIAKAVDKGN